MTISHAQLVEALVKSPFDIIGTLSAFTADLWHGATGVAGEAGELLEALVMSQAGAIDRENVVEELGDLEFYVEQIRQRVGISRDNSASVSPLDIELDMLNFYGSSVAINASAVLDIVKKTAIHNKELDVEALRVALRNLDRSMSYVRLSLGISRDETIAANIAKLSKRYESLTYSDKAAQERADKAGEEQPRRFFGNMG